MCSTLFVNTGTCTATEIGCNSLTDTLKGLKRCVLDSIRSIHIAGSSDSGLVHVINCHRTFGSHEKQECTSGYYCYNSFTVASTDGLQQFVLQPFKYLP